MLEPTEKRFSIEIGASMSWGEIVGLVTFAATLLGIILTVVLYRKSSVDRKLLKYESGLTEIPLASQRSLEDYNISIIYRSSNGEEQIDSAFVHYLRFANFGTVPILREDIAPANRLRIEVKGTRTLDIALTSVKRDVSGIEVSQQKDSDNLTYALIEFDFLDQYDGALIRIITTGHPASISLRGDIIGMPEGILKSERDGSGTTLGSLAVGLFFVSWLGVTGFLYRWIAGTWGDVWLMLMPLVTFVLLVTLLITIVSQWPSGRADFPRELWFPERFIRTIEGIAHSDVRYSDLVEHQRLDHTDNNVRG